MAEKTFEIDGKRLKEELKVRGLNLTTASERIGYGKTYFTNCIKNGKIGTRAAMLLEATFNIKSDAYVLRSNDPEEPKKPEEKFDLDKLYEVIYTAVYHATKKALEG